MCKDVRKLKSYIEEMAGGNTISNNINIYKGVLKLHSLVLSNLAQKEQYQYKRWEHWAVIGTNLQKLCAGIEL